MKTYKTWEVIKMLTGNPKLSFTSNGDQIGIIESQLIWFASGNKVCFTLDCSSHVDMFKKEWTLVQKPVTFMEAINSNRLIKPKGEEFNYECFSHWICEFPSMRMQDLDKIINGEWFIEEGI